MIENNKINDTMGEAAPSIFTCIYSFFASLNRSHRGYQDISELHKRNKDGYIDHCSPTSGYKGTNDVY